MFGSGKTLYHPLYIDNLVDAFVLAMDPGAGRRAGLPDRRRGVRRDRGPRAARSATALGVAVKIPHYPVWPVVVAGHVCEKVCKPFGITPPIFPRRVDWYRQNRAFNIDKAKRDLGYRPRVGLDEGLRRTYDWYRAERML